MVSPRRLDGLEIDASGTVRANYTNGQNDPLGKIVLANFNNQNGLKQIGNATYVATAVQVMHKSEKQAQKVLVISFLAR